MIAVLDVNVYVSAAMSPTGPPAELIRRWQAGAFRIVVSDPIKSELAEVFARPHVDALIRRSGDWSATLIARIQEATSWAVPTVPKVIQDDPDDDVILATAEAGGADHVVTGDKHLLVLGHFRGIRIVTPRKFLAILEAEAS